MPVPAAGGRESQPTGFVDPRWCVWVAENLTRGASVERLASQSVVFGVRADVGRGGGFSPDRFGPPHGIFVDVPLDSHAS